MPTPGTQSKYGIYSDIVPAAKAPVAPAPKPGLLQSIKNFFTGTKAPEAAPAPELVKAPVRAGSIYSDLIPKAPAAPVVAPTKPSLLSRTSDKIAASVEPPSLDRDIEIGKKGSVGRTLSYLPSELARNLPFGVGDAIKGIQDDPEAAADVTGMDLVRNLPGAVLDVGKGFIKSALSYPLTFYGATSKVQQDLGLPGAPGTDREGNVNVNVPGLGPVTNLQQRTKEAYERGSFPEKPGALNKAESVATGVGLTAEELLNGLFTAEIANLPFRPRTTVSARGVAAPENVKVANPPRTGRLYEAPTASKPVPAEVIQKIAAEKGVPLKNFDPKAPTYFRIKGTSGGQVIGEIVQIKPSYFETFMSKFKGDVSQVPTTQLQIVGQTTKALAELQTPQAAQPPAVIPTHKPTLPQTPTIVPGTPEAMITPPPAQNAIPAGANMFSDLIPKAPEVAPNVPEVAPNVPVVASQTPEVATNAGPVVTNAPVPTPEAPLELKPSVARTPEQIKTEAVEVFGDQKVGAAKQPKGLKPFAEEPKYRDTEIGKTEIKNLFASEEFKKNPTLLVDDAKNLTFKGEKTSFSIKPEAIGLNPEKLKTGQKINVSEKALKEKGAPQQMRVYQNGNTVADIGSFRDDTPIKLGGMEKIKPVELPELVDIARELMGDVPKIRTKVSRMMGGGARGVFVSGEGPNAKSEIRLKADLFDPKNNSIEQVAKTLAHEIGHLTDWLPDKTLKRGNLLGRLLSLRKFGEATFENEKKIIANSTIKNELTRVSEYWRPYDKKNASKEFLAYRNSGKELYADAISMLYNSPGLLQQMAPTFYREFFDALDQKPAVRDAYFEVQSLLSGDKEALTGHRREGVRQMFKEGDYKAIELQNERVAEMEAKRRSFIDTFKFNVIDKNYPMIDRVAALEKKGVKINPDDNPIYYLEERNYLGGKIKGLLSKYVEPVYMDLQNAGVDWTTFGEALFYERIIAGDRSVQANPRGITPKVASELYNDVISKLDAKQAVALRDGIKKFRQLVSKIADEAYEEGLYTPELYAKMKENPAYVTFQVLDHLDETVTSKVYKSIGTFKDIANPADSTVLKIIATVRAIERNKVNRTSVDFLKEFYSKDIQPAEKKFTGKSMQIKDSKDPKQKTIIVMRNGKPDGYYVDPYVAHSINNDSIGQNNAVMSLLRPIAAANRKIFRPLFIGYNLGFQGFNVVRDFMRFWKNIPGMTLTRAFKRYAQGAGIAKVRAFGMGENPTPKELDAFKKLVELEENQVFSVSYSKLNEAAAGEDTQIEQILNRSQLGSFKGPEGNAIMKPINKLLDFIQNVGEMAETLPKAAGYYELNNGKPLTREQRSYLRKYLGSPDFLAGGYMKQATNELFLFSNAIAQGMRSDFEVATQPNTRSGYWWKTAKINLLPKVLMLAASLGLFGAGVKKMMDDASEYDKTNYTIVPLGSEGDKTVYLRIPQDEAGRLMGGLFWKGLSLLNPEDKKEVFKDLADVISFMGGQVPNMTPSITVPNAIYEYLSGENPYDDFRNRNVLTDQQYLAGGAVANKQMLKWVFEQLGGGIFYRFQIGDAQEKGPVEKIFTAPLSGNIIGRFIKVSNFGETERLRNIKRDVQSTEAQRQLADADAVNKGIKAAIDAGATTPDKYKEYQKQVLVDVFGPGTVPKNELERANRLMKKFRLGVVKGSSDVAVGALVDATSNAQKIAILRDLRTRMETQEYKDFVNAAVKEQILSVDTANEANRQPK